MKSILNTLCFLFLSSIFISYSSYAEVGVNAKFKLSPVGDFSAKSKEIKGFATQKGDAVEAENIIVSVKSLTTGIDLRDDHMKNKYLEVNKYPDIKLLKAKGSKGKGKGLFEIKGIKKVIPGTYSIQGSELTAQFNLKLSDFKINGIKYLGVGVNDEVQILATVPLK